MSNEPIEWIVNDSGELGVKIGDRFAFCYKGRSIDYGGTHDDGSPMLYRAVEKREFGETIRPAAEWKGEIVVEADGTYRMGDDWKQMPKTAPHDADISITGTVHGSSDATDARIAALEAALRWAIEDIEASRVNEYHERGSGDLADFDRETQAKLVELRKLVKS
jgi:hypothetical protein